MITTNYEVERKCHRLSVNSKNKGVCSKSPFMRSPSISNDNMDQYMQNQRSKSSLNAVMHLCYTHVLLTTKGTYDESDLKTMQHCKKKVQINFLKNHEKHPLVFHQLNQSLCMDGEADAISVPFQGNWVKSLTHHYLPKQPPRISFLPTQFQFIPIMLIANLLGAI